MRLIAGLRGVPLAVLVGATFAWVGPEGVAAAATPPGSAKSTPLKAPRTTDAQDTKYFTDITEADSALVTYEQKQGNVALRALLTDGSAFCALLRSGEGIDEALVAEASGARSAESQTHLPLSVTTFNAIEAVALLTLCAHPSRSSCRPQTGPRSAISNTIWPSDLAEPAWRGATRTTTVSIASPSGAFELGTDRHYVGWRGSATRVAVRDPVTEK